MAVRIGGVCDRFVYVVDVGNRKGEVVDDQYSMAVSFLFYVWDVYRYCDKGLYFKINA